ncbi:MAG: class I SAM-dependent methyltransferase [Desulfomicrobium sp.]
MKRKNGMDVNYYDNIRYDIIKLIKSPVGCVLDIGCGSGATLMHLKKTQLAQYVVGVDINAQQLEIATQRGVDEVYLSDLSEPDWPFAGALFDRILLLDVLEHMVDPWTVVSNLTHNLAPRGQIIASIPNIQNIRVLWPLFFGNWEYKDSGILDITHLRFFTKRTAIQIFETANLNVTSVLHNVEGNWLPRLLNRITLRIFERFITVQYLLVSQKF